MLVAAALVSVVDANGQSCVIPTGIDDSTPGSVSSVSLSLPSPEATGDPLGVFGNMIVTVLPELTTYETPIGFRLVQLINIGIWNTAAAYHPTSLDYFSRVEVSNERRRCEAPEGDASYELHRKVTFAYAFNFAVKAFLPSVSDLVDAKLVEFGLDPNVCDITTTENVFGIGEDGDIGDAPTS